MSVTHEEMVELIVETLEAGDGAGSDLVTGDRFGEWLEVRGNLDVPHLASVVMVAMEPRIVTTEDDFEALPIGSVISSYWSDGSHSPYQTTRVPEGSASCGSGFGLAGGSHWLAIAGWGAINTVLYEATV